MYFLKFQFNILFTKKVLRFKKINAINRESWSYVALVIPVFFIHKVPTLVITCGLNYGNEIFSSKTRNKEKKFFIEK